MTTLKFIALLSILEGAWFAMWFVMQKKATPKRVVLIALCFTVFYGAFVLGAYWNHTDFTCHPGQHCFPWGN